MLFDALGFLGLALLAVAAGVALLDHVAESHARWEEEQEDERCDD